MRIVLNEITPLRVLGACKRRLKDIPVTLSWHYSQSAKRNLAYLDSYRNIHKNERCFIIANGPSLKKMDLSRLRNEFTFSMNRAYLLYKDWGFTPSYFVCLNELVLDQFATDISKLQMPKFLNFSRRRYFKDLSNDRSMLFLRIGLHFRDYFCSDVTQEISAGGTVTFCCLQLAYFMGFSEVVLIGLDHNFIEKGIPNKTVIRREEEDENHCHPGYFPKGVKWQLPDLYRSELAYSLAREAFEKDGRIIVDATIDGKCNIFRKVSFEDCFKKTYLRKH